MERRVDIIHGHSESGRKLRTDVDNLVSNRTAQGWQVHSATTSVATCQTYNQHIYVQWCTTIVFEKKPARKK